MRADLRVALIGLRGSGKTSVGRALAELAGAAFVDLDQEVAAGSERGPEHGPAGIAPGSGLGAGAGELLAALGEAPFRALELEALRAVAARPGDQVLATGGGLVETPAARELLARGYACVWLAAPLELLRLRLEADPTPRPRLAGSSLAEELVLLEARRAGFYRELARAVVEVGDMHPIALATRILAELGVRP